MTNKSWDINKYWNYWLTLQKDNGIVPRVEGFKPSSAFDIKRINKENLKAIQLYITKYISKNTDEFKCQVWNCSKDVSRLYIHTFIRMLIFWILINKLDGDNIIEMYSEMDIPRHTAPPFRSKVHHHSDPYYIINDLSIIEYLINFT